jgi:hypothetical protein
MNDSSGNLPAEHAEDAENPKIFRVFSVFRGQIFSSFLIFLFI